MSCSVYAKSIIGVKLPQPPYMEHEKRGCKHGLKGGAKFCDECGLPTWVKVTEPVPGWEDGDPTFGKFNIEVGGGSDNRTYYVGTCFRETGDLMYSPPGIPIEIPFDFDFKALEEDLRKLLEPVGLWKNDQEGNPMRVGVWLFGYCSY